MMAATMFLGCRQLRPLRREVYGLEQRLNMGPTGPAATDPAVFAALSARTRRQDVRKLAAQDPLLARDLRIGRPDLARKYDDGGLVDLNNAPANTIADVCELNPDDADKIVSRRQLNGGSFSSIDELLVLVNLPFATWDRVRDRGVLLTK
jgi:DNA uptake protein ComE-like DNA-binding protein